MKWEENPTPARGNVSFNGGGGVVNGVGGGFSSGAGSESGTPVGQPAQILSPGAPPTLVQQPVPGPSSSSSTLVIGGSSPSTSSSAPYQFPSGFVHGAPPRTSSGDNQPEVIQIFPQPSQDYQQFQLAVPECSRCHLIFRCKMALKAHQLIGTCGRYLNNVNYFHFILIKYIGLKK